MLFNICLYALKVMAHLDVRKQYCTLIRGKWYLDSRKLNQDDDGKAILAELSKRSSFERQFLASWQMILMLEYFDVNKQFVTTAQELRKIEEDIRNDVAHDITPDTRNMTPMAMVIQRTVLSGLLISNMPVMIAQIAPL